MSYKHVNGYFLKYRINKKIRNIPYSIKSTFGKVLTKEVLYIGSECSIDKGEEIFKKLMETYPNHPIYQKDGMNPNGLSKVQNMIQNNKIL